MAKIDAWRCRDRNGVALFYWVAGILHVTFPKPFVARSPALRSLWSWQPGRSRGRVTAISALAAVLLLVVGLAFSLMRGVEPIVIAVS